MREASKSAVRSEERYRDPSGVFLRRSEVFGDVGLARWSGAQRWLISDADVRREEVRGSAAVGHQPLLRPGESSEHTGGTRPVTSRGTTSGARHRMSEDARSFEAPVPELPFAFPGLLH